MAPLIPSARLTLSYPLYGCDFDPLDSGRLVVGGGGGPGANGVGNKITLLDTSRSAQLEEIGDIELSKDEDNVTSLAVGQRKGNVTKVFAGINSSAAEVKKGANAHFRVFEIGQSTGSKIKQLSKSKLFAGTEKDVYQRITRLAKPYGNQPQLGAVTTGFAKNSELVLFDTSTTSPPNSRGSVRINKEVVDVDFIQTGEAEFQVVYCTEHDIYTKKISPQTGDEEPVCIYVTPFSDSFEKPAVPKFRALRWLTNDLLLALGNIYSNGGAVLQILRLPSDGKGQARVVRSHRLSSPLKKGVGLAVSNLTPPTSPTERQGYTQFVIAIAGQNSSISLFKVDLQVEAGVSLITNIKPFRTFKEVHPQAITGISFSNFIPPSHPVTASTPPQCLKLASVSASNTVVVYTLPLFPVPLSVKKGQSKTPRYVIALPSTKAAFGAGIVLSIIVAALIAILVQSALEIRGVVNPVLNASNYVPTTWQEAIGKPYVFPKDYGKLVADFNRTDSGDVQPPPQFFESLKAKRNDAVVVIMESEDGVKAHAHNEEKHGPHGGRPWEELPKEQKEGWKMKLKDAGHWTEDMGETILKGVVFGELAGAVAGAVGGG